MFRRLGILLAALALFTVAGGHWAVLQSVAWAQMLRDYSKDAPVAVALSKTFSGEYPCAMCKNIAAAKKSEQKTPLALKAEKKAEVFTDGEAAALPRRTCQIFFYGAGGPSMAASRSDAPPKPVPILA